MAQTNVYNFLMVQTKKRLPFNRFQYDVQSIRAKDQRQAELELKANRLFDALPQSYNQSGE